MCGLVGFLHKQGYGPVGAHQVAMLNALFRRGPDSTGIAIYGRPRGDAYVLHARLGDADRQNGHVVEAIEKLGFVKELTARGHGVRAEVVWADGLAELADVVEHANGHVDVLSLCRS